MAILSVYSPFWESFSVSAMLVCFNLIFIPQLPLLHTHAHTDLLSLAFAWLPRKPSAIQRHLPTHYTNGFTRTFLLALVAVS